MDRWRRRGAAVAIALAALVACGRAWADDRWWVAQSGHFIVIGDGGTKQVRRVARELDQLRAVFESVLSLRVASGRPFFVLAADGERSMRRLVPEYWERRGGVRPAGLFITGDEKDWAIVRSDYEGSTRVIYHEYAHLLARLSLGPLPLWLVEGLAELFASTEVRDDVVRIGTAAGGHAAKLEKGPPVPVARLVAVDFGSAEYGERAQVSEFYAESAILTHYLLMEDNGKHRPRLNEFLRLIEEGATESDALDRAFGGAAALERELGAYVRGQMFTFIEFKGTVAVEAIAVRELRPAEAAAFLADFLLHTGQVKRARAYVGEAVRTEPDLGFAHLQRGTLLARDGRTEEAAAAYAEARRLAPQEALTHYRFGTFARSLPTGASSREEALRSAVRVDPGFAPARGALAQLLLEEGRSPDEALALAAEAVRLDPGSVGYRITALELKRRLGCTEDAAREKRDLLRVARYEPDALEALVRYYESEGRVAEAEVVLRRIRTSRSRSVVAISALAAFLRRQDRPDESEALLREGLSIEPRSYSLLNELAFLHADLGVRLAEALSLVEEALKLAPSEPALQDTKAWVLFRLGRLREAEQWARRSLDARESPLVREHLGDILGAQERSDEALAAWRQALQESAGDSGRNAALEDKISEGERRRRPK